MRTRIFGTRLAFTLGLGTALAAFGPAQTEYNFDGVPIGTRPPGFTFGSMRQPDPGRWTVQKRDEDIVLWHEPDDSTGYSLAIADGVAPSDLMLSARLRVTDGARSGGLVWRYLDDSHYYSLVLDLRRGAIALNRVHGGNRIEAESEDGLELDVKAWHVLKIVHTGDTIRASIDGIGVFEDRNRLNRWPGRSSQVGLIATGNSSVEFDDLRVASRSDH